MKRFLKHVSYFVAANLIALTTAAHAADPNTWNGDKIIANCAYPNTKAKVTSTSLEQFMRAQNCYGYVRGSGDALIGAGACLPPQVTTQQLIDVAVKFLRENPQHRHEHATAIFMDAWGTAWPCKESKHEPDQQQFTPSPKAY